MAPARKTLAGRLFAALFALSLAVALAATVAATAASYAAYERDAESTLLAQAAVYASAIAPAQDEESMAESLAGLPLADVRSTLVAADGTVLYDSDANASDMENHAGRAEIAEARDSGQGVVARHSQTLDADTLYAAVLVRDGIVLRLAETRTSLASFLGGIAPQMGVSLVVVLLASVLLSRLLTRMVVRPLREIDLSRPLENRAYRELQPLLQRVDEQRQTLERQNAELADAANMRREFAGNVSHEMKTPLQVIGGYAELMEGGVVAQEDVPRFAGLILQEAKSMRALVDDVLTLSRLDESAGAGEPVSLAEVCRRVEERLRPAAQGKGIALEMGLDEDAVVSGVPAMVEQMAYNLAENAIKYSPAGARIMVQARREGDAVTLSVADEGPGIPPEYRERVFERFFRIDSSRSRETGGTGLGLAIVKHAAESSGGSVHVEDAPGGGALFIVDLPAFRER